MESTRKIASNQKEVSTSIIDMDKILTVPVPDDRDPEMNQILKELNEEIALLAKGPISPIRRRSVPKINSRYHKKRGDWQLPESNNETEHRSVTKKAKKIRIRPYSGSTNNTLMSISVNSRKHDVTKPRVVAIERLQGTITKTITCKNVSVGTSISQKATSSTPAATVRQTAGTKVIPVITLEDEPPLKSIPPPRILEPAIETNNSTPPVANNTTDTGPTPAAQTGKKKRKRNNRNKRHGLRYEREGEILYKWTKRGGKRERKVVKNPIWRGPGLPPPNNPSS
ncbi:hypothetical protein PV328_012250 [Microctonus aethiopoides]|uniref:Uncharacterized protein n=1 Tax=Microctonus aethiopoides TaxID=144406 RepID=A0AA39ETX6_9HYME|nr:hypothetical protein PV328_012250 [Microctonus aethiopoides]